MFIANVELWRHHKPLRVCICGISELISVRLDILCIAPWQQISMSLVCLWCCCYHVVTSHARHNTWPRRSDKVSFPVFVAPQGKFVRFAMLYGISARNLIYKVSTYALYEKCLTVCVRLRHGQSLGLTFDINRCMTLSSCNDVPMNFSNHSTVT